VCDLIVAALYGTETILDSERMIDERTYQKTLPEHYAPMKFPFPL